MIIENCLATKSNAKVIHEYKNISAGHLSEYYSGYDLEAVQVFSVSTGSVRLVTADSVVVSYNTTTYFVYSKLRNIRVKLLQSLSVGDMLGDTRAGQVHIEYLIPVENQWPVRVTDTLTLYKHDPYDYLVTPIDQQGYITFNTDQLDLIDGSFIESYTAFVGSDQFYLLGSGSINALDGESLLYDQVLFATKESVAGDSVAMQNAFSAALASPMKVVFWFGIDELSFGTFFTADEFYRAYKQTIQSFLNRLEVNCAGYLLSIPNITLLGSYRTRKEYNDAISNLSKEFNMTYIDLDAMTTPYTTIDQIHFTHNTNAELVKFLKESVGFRADDEAPLSDSGLSSSSNQLLDRFVSRIIQSLNLNPYIATLNRDTPRWLRMDKLKDHKVSAVMIEAGYLYNRVHQKVQFRSPLVDSQAKAATELNMPFGLYFTSRARSESEALDEIYELAFIVRKYPPKLGVWVKTEFIVPLARNTQILRAHERALVRLGLIGKIGIWCDRKQLELIAWDELQATWFLWLDEQVKEVSELETIADPQMFDIDGKG